MILSRKISEGVLIGANTAVFFFSHDKRKPILVVVRPGKT